MTSCGIIQLNILCFSVIVVDESQKQPLYCVVEMISIYHNDSNPISLTIQSTSVTRIWIGNIVIGIGIGNMWSMCRRLLDNIKMVKTTVFSNHILSIIIYNNLM